MDDTLLTLAGAAIGRVEKSLQERTDEVDPQRKVVFQNAQKHTAMKARLEAEIEGLREQLHVIGQAKEALDRFLPNSPRTNR